MKRTAIWIAAVGLLASAAGGQVTIEVGSSTAAPGGTTSVAVTVRTTRDDVGGTGNGIGWSGPFTFDGCVVNPDIERQATAFGFMPPGCRDTDGCSSLRALVLSFALPELVPPLADGAVLYTCGVTVRGDAEPGEYILDCTGPDAATGDAVPIDASCLDGSLTVGAPTPTSTPGSPSPTPTATVPVPTPTASPCPGDCNGNRVVSIDELVTAVRIALGEVGVAVCPAANPDRDLVVAINELVRAVGSALDGCGSEGGESRIGSRE